jgi:RHS repeat-associated protein
LYQATQSITFEPGYSTPAGANLVAEIVPGGFGVPQATNLTGTADANINWIQSTSYDETGTVIADSKEFYDGRGQAVQLQNKAFYRAALNTVFTHILASQPVRDAYGRDAAMTLPAPIDYADFSYRSNFLQHNSSGSSYNHQNFDLYTNGSTNTDKTNSPDPLWDASTGSPVQGTLAWYYSTGNTWEPYTPVTNYPYTRETYYSDGTGNNKKRGGTGEAFVMGGGHELAGFTTPVANELDFYLQVRNRFFATTDLGALPVNLQNQAIQSVSHDVNGREGIVILDRAGKTLMKALPGGNDVMVNNTISIAAGAYQYIKLLGNTSVTFTGTGIVYQMDGNEGPATNVMAGGVFSNGMSYLFPAGYYKVVNGASSNPATISYSSGFTSVSYYYYNQLGKLVAMIAPEGVKRLYGTNGTGLNNYPNRSAVPYITTYEYDTRGELIAFTDPDRGTTQYMYRLDGKIRFSQNAAQAAAGNGSFSFTNYDALGRPVASGQYTPGTGGNTFDRTALAGILETTALWGGLTNGTMTDVSISQYDVPDNSHGLSGYTQDAANLAGAISKTQRYSTIAGNAPAGTNLVSATWYNYDEEGKAVWTIKYISGLGYKTVDYTYNALGLLTKRVFQKNTSAETFVHYYDYDPVNKQLWHVYTNTVDNTGTWKLQATYYYFLHGGVKRVELAGNLQGIDYTYTLQGALKAINNSNKAQDPGGDGSANGFGTDAFGEVLDFFPNDYVNGRGSTVSLNGVNTSGIVTQENYAGNIKAMTWYSEKPTSTGLTDAPTTYIYQYDPKYQFTESTWGTGLNFGSNPASFTTTTNNKEKVGNTSGTIAPYDENGNILYLQRTDGSGNLTDQFTYNYTSNTNRLSSVTSIVNGASQTYATYTYDANGQVTAEATADGSPQKYLVYDAMGKVTAVYLDAAYSHQIAGFVYDEKGYRIKKLSFNGSNQLNQVTYYAGDVIYTQAVTNGGATYGTVLTQEYQIDGGGGRIGVYYPQAPVYAYELRDHLGSVRTVIAQNGSSYQTRMYNDYYPFGRVIGSGGTNDYRYNYQGQYSEMDGETGWNTFDLRMYDSRIARWLQFDPKGQYYSPYIGMGNDPVAKTDPDGGGTDNFFRDLVNGGVFWSDDNAKYGADPTRYQDLGTEYIDGDYLVRGFPGMPDGNGGVKWIPLHGSWDQKTLDSWKQFYLKHERSTPDSEHWIQGSGTNLLGDPVNGYHWGWNEALGTPMVDPIDIVAGGLPAVAKVAEGMFVKSAAVALMRSGSRMTADQIALKELVYEATKAGTKPLSRYEAEAAMELATEVGYPGFRVNAADMAPINNHWGGGPHFHMPGVLKSTHIPFIP